MKVQLQSRLFRFGGMFLGALIWLANSGNPPTGRTNAPFDGSCNDCHSGGNFNGTVEINGLPGTIAPNTTYNLSLTMTPTSGSPVRGGFQVVVVDGNNANSGNINNANAQSGTEFFSSREYLEHRNPKNFGGNPITWDFTWQSPASAAGNTIKFYYIGNFCNGSGSNGDIAFPGLETLTFEGAPPLTCQITSQTNVDCFGGNTGSATVEADGGTPPYTYKWNNNQTTQTAINLIAGTYTVTVTGGGTATATVVITQSPQISASATVNNPITCANPAATVTASASGGAGGFSFAWSNGDTGNPASYSNPGPGNVTITDANGCPKVATFTVNSNTIEPTAAASAPAAFTCANPTMTLSGNGTSLGANFSYAWTASGGGTILSGGTTLNPMVSGCGTYTLLVTNNINGCTKEASVTPTCNISLPSLTTTGNTLTCANTSVVVTASSNASNPAYAWVGPNFSSNLQNPTVTTAGVYTCTVTNTANGCSKTSTATVTQNTTAPGANAIGTNLNCAITNDTIFASSNTNGVTYSWTGPNGFSSNIQNPIVSLSGNYILTVNNPVNGCVSLDTAVVSSNTSAPNLSTTGATINCTNPTVQICASSTTPNVTYAWSGPNGFTSTVACPNVNQGGVYSVTVTSGDNGCTNTGSATVNIDTQVPSVNIAPPNNLNCNTATVTINASASSNGPSFTYNWTTTNGNIQSGANTPMPVVNAAGTYNLLLTNTNNGCTSTGSALVTQTPAVTASASATNVSCNGGNNGSASATPAGGNGTFTYLWSSNATTATASNLTAGTYTVTVTDGENCTATASAVVTQPNVLTANASSTNQTAAGVNDGTATANPAGGTPGYSYLWSNNLTTQQITGLAPGTYTVTVTDIKNCTAVQTVNVNQFNCNLSAEASASNVTCNGAANGTASISTTGANGNVTYTWSNNATTQTVNNLAPGTYTVTVKDAANCTQVKNVSVTEPPVLSPNATATNETGAGQNNGTATAAPTGGTPGYTYLWNNNATTNSISGLAPGVYTVTIKDSKNCTATQSVTVAPFNCTMTASTSTTLVSCFGGNNGTASASAVNSTGNLSYKWSTGAISISITGLIAGVYSVTVTDGAGCTDTETATVGQPPLLQGTVTVLNDVNCPLDQTGQVAYQAIGGTAPYTFSTTGGTPTGFPAGTYTVTITDNNGCTTTNSFTIKSLDVTAPGITCPANISICKPAPGFYPLPTATDNCAPAPIVTLVSGIPSGSSFEVGTTTQVFRATDLSGNSSTCSFNVTVFALPTASYTFVNEMGNNGKGSINLTPITGTAPFTYEWTKDGVFYSKEEDLNNLNAGSYSVKIKDTNGCELLIENIIIKNVVGSYEPEWINALRLYPSPTESVIRLDAADIDIRAAQIMTPQGRIILNINPSDLQQEMDVTELPSGIYYLRLTSSEGWNGVIKWIKM